MVPAWPAPFLLTALLAAPLAAQAPHEAILKQKFQAELEAIGTGFDGVAGLHLVDLTPDLLRRVTPPPDRDS